MFMRNVKRVAIALFVLGTAVSAAGPVLAADTLAWKKPSNALIIDAYELNIIDWQKMLTDKRITAFIGKASDGLSESFSCKGDHRGDTVAHCRTIWRKYAVSRELYHTRRMLAKANGLLWGAYHLGRPGNPVEQANHFLDFAEPADDELIAIDIEDNDPTRFMSLADAEIFAGHIRTRTGRWPILYTNHNTARHIAAKRKDYPVLSRLPLWYARYKPSISGVFPMGNWDSYAIWQFSTRDNCNRRACPYRVPGTLNDIDVNVVAMDANALKQVWPFGELVPVRPDQDEPAVFAEAPAPKGSASSQNYQPLALAPQPASPPVSPAFAAFDRAARHAAGSKGALDGVVTSAIPVPVRLEEAFGNPRTETGEIPVPVLSERFDAPDVVAFWQVSVPVMPQHMPLFAPVEAPDQHRHASAPVIPAQATELDYQDW